MLTDAVRYRTSRKLCSNYLSDLSTSMSLNNLESS